MITMRDFMEMVDYRITEGSDFCWTCYGPNAYQLDSWNGDQNGHSLNIVFDTQTQVVYEMTACDYKNNRAYRLFHPDYKDKYYKDAKNHTDNADIAWDDISYIDLETVEDMLQKAQAIVDGRDYDTRVSVPIDMPESELFNLMKLAHEKDITLNQLVEEAIQEAIKEYERDPEGMRTRAQKWKETKAYED